jgi:nitrogen-specific signal transduction histidine kinase
MKKSRSKHTAQLAPAPRMPETIGALASRMADDFNNILTTVMGACTLIEKDDPYNSELLQCVALIRTSAERAADLSDRLMHAGRRIMGGGYSENHSQNVTSMRDKTKVYDIVSSNKHSGGSA